MEFKELFRDYYELSYTAGTRTDRIEDIPITSLVILRKSRKGWSINYLHTGSSFNIPPLWIDIFDSFIVHSGALVMELDTSKMDMADKFGYFLCGLCIEVSRGMSCNGDKVLKILGELTEIGSREFSEYFEELTETRLPEINYMNQDRSFVI